MTKIHLSIEANVSNTDLVAWGGREWNESAATYGMEIEQLLY